MKNLATLLVVEFQKYHQLFSWSKIWCIGKFGVSDIVFTEINLKNSISGNPVILNLATLLVVEFQKYHQLISWSKIWAIASFDLSSDIVFMEIN